MDILLRPLRLLFVTVFMLRGANVAWLEPLACAMAMAMVVLHPLAWVRLAAQAPRRAGPSAP